MQRSRSESEGSDDSGFDDGITSDEFLQSRIAKMRDMINLASSNPTAMVGSTASVGNTDRNSHTERFSVSADRRGQPTTQTLPQPSFSVNNYKHQDNSEILDKLNALRVDKPRTSSNEWKPSRVPSPEQVADVNDVEGVNDEVESEEDDSYELEWTIGPLKIQFKEDRHGQTVIRKVFRKGSTVKGVQMARAGDVLLCINGISVRGLPFADVVERLCAPRLPVTLMFQPPRVEEEEVKEFSESGMSGQSTQPSHHEKHSHSVASYDSTATHERSLNDDRESLPRYSSIPVSPFAEDAPPGPDEYDVVWTDGSLGCGLRQRDGVPVVKSTVATSIVDESVKQISVGDTMILINSLWCEVIGFKAVVETLQHAPKPIYLRFRRSADGSQPVVPSLTMDEPRASLGAVNDASLIPPSRTIDGPQVPSSFPVDGARAAPSLSLDGPGRNSIYKNTSDDYHQPPPYSTPNNEIRPLSRFPAPVEVLRDSQVTDQTSAGTLGPNQYTVLWKEGPLGIQIKGKVRNGTTVVVVTKFTGTGNPALCSQITIGDVFIRIAGVDVASIGLSGAFELLRTVKKPVVLVFERVNSSGSSTEETAGGKEVKRCESIVPSFRLMRERQAAAAAAVPTIGTRTSQSDAGSDNGYGRQTFSRSSPKPREAVGDEFAGRRSEAISQYTDRSSISGDNYMNAPMQIGPPPMPPPPLYPGGDDLDQPPPPPSYSDLFTESGRLKDGKAVINRPSPQHSSSSSRFTVGPSISQPGVRGVNSLMGPPPPAYHQATSRASSDGRDSIEDNSSMDRLRQQYVEADRKRNQHQQAQDFSSTQFSSYSEFDDSGVVVPRKAPTQLPSSIQPNHLWIHWAEGPLGITFRRTDNQIVVSRLTGAGFSPGLEQLRPGDWLISFGNERAGVTYLTKDLRLSETMELIKKLPKPVDMCFVVR